MSATTPVNPVKLVEDALENARAAGHDPNDEMITIFWRIARGEASSQEIHLLAGERDVTWRRSHWINSWR